MIKFTKNIIIQALDSAPTPIVIVDARKAGMPVVYLNSAGEVLTGRDGAEMIGAPFGAMLAEGSLPGSGERGAPDAAQLEGRVYRQRWQTSNGPSVPLDIRVSPLHDRPDRTGFWMLSVVGDAVPARDAAALRDELVDAQRQIKSLQRNDSVTGLANRSAFDEVLERDWSISRREQRRIGVIVFSVDCLAEYREIFGRHATDSLLQKVGHAISGTLRRAGDFGARIAGDRFGVLIGDSTEDEADICASRIAAKVRNLAIPHPRSTIARFATVTYGTASEIPAWTEPSVALLEEAERRLETNCTVVEERQAAEKSEHVSEEIIS